MVEAEGEEEEETQGVEIWAQGLTAHQKSPLHLHQKVIMMMVRNCHAMSCYWIPILLLSPKILFIFLSY